MNSSRSSLSSDLVSPRFPAETSLVFLDVESQTRKSSLMMTSYDRAKTLSTSRPFGHCRRCSPFSTAPTQVVPLPRVTESLHPPPHHRSSYRQVVCRILVECGWQMRMGLRRTFRHSGQRSAADILRWETQGSCSSVFSSSERNGSVSGWKNHLETDQFDSQTTFPVSAWRSCRIFDLRN